MVQPYKNGDAMGWLMLNSEKITKSFEEHLNEGALHFFEKYGFAPNACRVNPDVFYLHLEKVKNNPLVDWYNIPADEPDKPKVRLVLDDIKIIPDKTTLRSILYFYYDSNLSG